jgi:hypothetical protein
MGRLQTGVTYRKDETTMNNYEQLLKNNVLLLAAQHKKQCNDPECGIHLFLVAALLEKAGYKLTQEEKIHLQ